MEKLRKILSVLLVITMIISITACSADSESTDSTDSTDTASAQTDTAEDEEEISAETMESETSETPQAETLTTEFNCTEGILDLQVIQVMANGLDSDTGEMFRMTDFVAGKNTLMQVYFENPTEILQDGSMVLEVTKDDEVVAQLLPINSGESNVAIFTPKSIADAGNWASGDYAMHFTAGDSMEALRTVSFRDAKKIKVLAVPVIANYGGTAVSCEGEWQTAGKFTQDCYPLANDGMEYILGNEVDLSGEEYDLTTDEGMYNTWYALTQLQTPNNDYELILGFARNRQGADSSLQGYTYGKPANIITESDGDMQPTVAHEIAHCYNVGDEYEGGTINNAVNPAPYGMSGSDWVNREETVSGNKEAVLSVQSEENYNSGSAVLPDQAPTNVAEMEALNNVGSFMGSGSDSINDYWITSDIWKQLYKSFVFGDSSYEGEVTENTEETGEAEDTEDMNMSAKTASRDIVAIDITGKINKDDTFEPTPWFSYQSDTASLTTKSKGAYSIVMSDKDGKNLSTQYFDASFFTQSNPPKELDFSSVSITAQLSDGTKNIKILHGDKEIYSKDVSENAPEISFNDVKGTLSGKQTISWNGSDKDGDKLYYELWYCPNEDEFINIVSVTEETSCEIDFDKYAGTTEGYFYLYATDGVTTSEIDSDYVQVEYKAPEFLTEQKSVPEYKITDEIIFDADIYDKQDGWLYDENTVSWSLNGHDFISGSALWVYPYELTPGVQEFTVKATNSQGVTAEKKYSFNIIDDESALPNDWSKTDVKKALANGFVAPLSNVNSAITRGQFAKLMSNLYWTVWEEGSPSPEYKDGVVTDCGNDDYDQFLMVNLGVMTAENGKFNPNGNLTQQEAAVIMYKLCAIADPQVAEALTSDEEMVDSCLASGVMEEQGDNIYTADSKITGQLALVRCNRLYEAIFGE